MSPLLLAHSLNIVTSLLTLQGGPAHVLHRKLTAGEVDSYVQTMLSDQAIGMGSMGNQNVKMAMEGTYVLKLGKLDKSKGLAEVTITNTATKTQMSGMMGAQQLPAQKPVKTVGTIDSRNRVKASQASPAMMSSMMGGAAGQSSGLMVELPDHAVKIGDSWMMDVGGMDMMGSGKHQIRVTLTGSGSLNGRATWKVKLAGHFPIDMDLGKIMKDAPKSADVDKNPMAGMLKGMSMKMKGTMDYTGTGSVDQQNGKTLRMDYTIGSNISMDMASMKMQMVGTAVTTMRLRGF